MGCTQIVLKSDEKLIKTIKALLEYGNVYYKIQTFDEYENDSELKEAIKECEANKKAILNGKRKPLSFEEFKKVSLEW